MTRITRRAIEKVLSGKYTKEDLDAVNKWYYSPDDTRININMTNDEFVLLKRTVFASIKEELDLSKPYRRPNRIFKYWAAAASIILIIGLTFLNLYQDEIPIKPMYIVKATQAGQKATIILPDGSKVKLNSNSTVKYFQPFPEHERAVQMEGEAFFDVKKDASRPFNIILEDSKITVLGTSFNINSYKDQLTERIALSSGSLKIASCDGCGQTFEDRILVPGEEAVIHKKSKKLDVVEFDPEEAYGWKDGLLILFGERMKMVNELENWYGVDITEENVPDESILIDARFDRQTLDNVLRSLSYTLNFEYEINNKQVRIKYKERR